MLIQEGVKLQCELELRSGRLRALLIQEGVKPRKKLERTQLSLRALLIQNHIFISILPNQADNPIITELESQIDN